MRRAQVVISFPSHTAAEQPREEARHQSSPQIRVCAVCYLVSIAALHRSKAYYPIGL